MVTVELPDPLFEQIEISAHRSGGEAAVDWIRRWLNYGVDETTRIYIEMLEIHNEQLQTQLEPTLEPTFEPVQ